MNDVNEARRELLAHYERERDELDVMIARLRRELGMAADVPVSRPSMDGNGGSDITRLSGGALNVTDLVRPGDLFGMTQTQAVRTFLERTNKQPASLQDIAAALYRGKVTERLIEGTGPLRNLSSILSRSADFVSVAKGRWGLAEWYPNRAIKRARATKAKDEAPPLDKKEDE